MSKLNFLIEIGMMILVGCMVSKAMNQGVQLAIIFICLMIFATQLERIFGKRGFINDANTPMAYKEKLTWEARKRYLTVVDKHIKSADRNSPTPIPMDEAWAAAIYPLVDEIVNSK